MAIWKKAFTLKQLNEMGKHCAVGHLGIEISAYGENWIEATMPIDLVPLSLSVYYMVACLWLWLKPLARWRDFSV